MHKTFILTFPHRPICFHLKTFSSISIPAHNFFQEKKLKIQIFTLDAESVWEIRLPLWTGLEGHSAKDNEIFRL